MTGNKIGVGLCLLLAGSAISASAQSTARATFDPSTTPNVQQYRLNRVPGGVVGTASSSPIADTSIQPGATYRYTVTAVADGVESLASNEVTVTIPGEPPPPPPPPPPQTGGFEVGDIISTKFSAPIRSAATNGGFATQIGTAPAAARAVVVAVSTAAIPGSPGAFWMHVDFEEAALPTGFIGSDNANLVTDPPPPPPPPPDPDPDPARTYTFTRAVTGTVTIPASSITPPPVSLAVNVGGQTLGPVSVVVPAVSVPSRTETVSKTLNCTITVTATAISEACTEQ